MNRPGAISAVLLCLACGSDARPPTGPAPTPAATSPDAGVRPAASYLEADHEERHPTRALLARLGEVRFAEDEQEPRAVGDRRPLQWPGQLVVIEEGRQRLRVYPIADQVRLLVWVDRADLHPVIDEPVAVAMEASRPPVGASSGIWLQPGVPVAIEKQEGDRALVRHDDRRSFRPTLSFTGWVPRRAVGQVFERIPETAGEKPDAAIPDGCILLDQPGGREIARCLAELPVTLTGPERAGHFPVLHRGEHMLVRGWTTRVDRTVPSGDVYGGLIGQPRAPTIPTGTCLHADLDGALVGVTETDVGAITVGRSRGWWQWIVDSPWGKLPLWTVEDGPQSGDRGGTVDQLPAMRTCR